MFENYNIGKQNKTFISVKKDNYDIFCSNMRLILKVIA